MSVVVLTGVLASSVSLYATVPQVLRAARTRSADGVSWESLILSLATFTLWCVYAVTIADHIQLVNNTIAVVLLAALAVCVLRADAARSCWPAVVAVVATGVASLLLVEVANSFTLAMVGTTISSLRMVPQTRLALSKTPLWGLCPWSTILVWVGMALWLAYAVMVGDVALALCSGIGITMQSAILAHRLPPRRTLASLAGGRLGDRVAHLAGPMSVRFPRRGDFELAA